MTNEEIFKIWIEKKEDPDCTNADEYFISSAALKELIKMGRQAGREEQREKDADLTYRRAIELSDKDSYVGVALVDMSIAIRTQGEEGAKAG